MTQINGGPGKPAETFSSVSEDAFAPTAIGTGMPRRPTVARTQQQQQQQHEEDSMHGRTRSEIGRSITWTAAVMGAVLAVCILAPSPVAAQEEKATEFDPHAHEMTDVWDISRGGELYDNWMAVMEVDAPEGTHPA
ncbi:MAG: hypothetical protein ACREE7_14200, partial [Dongiaceae bacterium]